MVQINETESCRFKFPSDENKYYSEKSLISRRSTNKKLCAQLTVYRQIFNVFLFRKFNRFPFARCFFHNGPSEMKNKQETRFQNGQLHKSGRVSSSDVYWDDLDPDRPPIYSLLFCYSWRNIFPSVARLRFGTMYIVNKMFVWPQKTLPLAWLSLILSGTRRRGICDRSHIRLFVWIGALYGPSKCPGRAEGLLHGQVGRN